MIRRKRIKLLFHHFKEVGLLLNRLAEMHKPRRFSVDMYCNACSTGIGAKFYKYTYHIFPVLSAKCTVVHMEAAIVMVSIRNWDQEQA